MKFKRSFAVILGLISLSAEAATQVELDSEAGDPIGQTGCYTYSDTTTTTSCTDVGTTFTLDPKLNYLKIFSDSASDDYTLEFSPPDGQSLVNGYYPNAQRHSPPSINPGILIGEDTRGCNAVSDGYFIVHEYVLNDTAPPKIAIDFKQECSGATGSLFGKIRINSSISTDISLPIAYAGRNRILKEGESVTLDGSTSFVGSGNTITRYAWTQVSPSPSDESYFDALDGVSANTATLDLAPTLSTLNQLALGGIEFVFELEIEDNNGAVSTDQVSVFVKSKSDPFTRIDIFSNPGAGPLDYIVEGEDGNGPWQFSPANAIITTTKNDGNGIQVEISGDSYWLINVAADNSNSLKTEELPYTYTLAQKFPFNDSGSPGLDVATDSRECSTIDGQFTINQLEWEGEEIKRLDASFIQKCNGSVTALEGTININAQHSSVPVIITAAEIAVSEGDEVELNASQTFDKDEAISSYKWTQTGGTTVTLDGDKFATVGFTAHTLRDELRREFLTFNLFVEDTAGFRAQQDVIVRIEQANTPPILGLDEGTLTDLTPITIDVFDNDTDIDGEIDISTFSIFNHPPFGSVIYNGDGTVKYTPKDTLDDNENEDLLALIERARSKGIRPQDRFSYTFRDNDGHTSELGWVIIYYDKVPLVEDATDEEEDEDIGPEFGPGANGLFMIALLLLAPLIRHKRKQ